VKTAAIPKTLIWEYKPTEYFRDCLKIQDKITRKVVPLELNKGQKVVQEAVDKQRRAGRPIRILILKYRQGGFSTWAEALLFWFCRFFAGMYMTVSLDIDSATHIFGIADRFYHYLPKSEKVFLPTVASNRKELKFDEPHGGGIIVETAGKSAAGHSYTLAGVHLSEVSRWPEDTDDARAGLMNSIPETPNTIIVVESVANGMSGWFCGEWFKPDCEGRRFVHVDLALSRDSCGIAMAHKPVPGCPWYEMLNGEPNPDARKVVLEVVLQVKPQLAPGSRQAPEIDFDSVRQFIRDWQARKFRIKGGLVTYDGWQSIDSRQILRKEGFRTQEFSLDRNLEGHDTLQELLNTDAIAYYPHPVLLREAKQLQLKSGRKVDHVAKGSKDVVDAAAGAAYHALKSGGRRKFIGGSGR